MRESTMMNGPVALERILSTWELARHQQSRHSTAVAATPAGAAAASLEVRS